MFDGDEVKLGERRGRGTIAKREDVRPLNSCENEGKLGVLQVGWF